MAIAKNGAGPLGKDGITRRHLVKITNAIGAAITAAVVVGKTTTVAFAQQVSDALGSVLPFQPVPTASTAGPTLQEFEACPARRAEPPSARRARTS